MTWLLKHASSICPLQQFSADIADNASTVCLAHLFTYQDFDEGTLGLAYVAPSKPHALGGLCPKRECSCECMEELIIVFLYTNRFLKSMYMYVFSLLFFQHTIHLPLPRGQVTSTLV